MALAQSPIFNEIKGVEEGMIYQSYRGSIMLRSRTTGGGKISERLQGKQATLSMVSSFWRTLTTAEQNAWAAAAPSFPYIDKFGNPQTPSGYQLFNTLNFFNVSAGNAPITLPPAPVTKIDYGPITVNTITPQNITLEWAGTTAVGVVLNLFVAPPVSKGVTRPPTRWRAIGSYPTTGAQPLQVAADWAAQWGELPASGRFWMMTEALSTDSWEHWTVYTDFGDLP